MPNHVHMVAVPCHAGSMALTLRYTHGRYVAYLKVRERRSGHVWQGRYFSCPLGPSHLWAALRYVERNPVRAGLVESAEAYEWSSSATHWQNGGGAGLLDLDLWQACSLAPRVLHGISSAGLVVPWPHVSVAALPSKRRLRSGRFSAFEQTETTALGKRKRSVCPRIRPRILQRYFKLRKLQVA